MDKVKARLDKLGLNVPTAGSIKDWDRDDIFYLENLQETTRLNQSDQGESLLLGRIRYCSVAMKILSSPF